MMSASSLGVDTQAILESLGHETEVCSSDIAIDLVLSTELCEVLESIQDTRLFTRKKRIRKGLRYQHVVTDSAIYFRTSYRAPNKVPIKYLITILETLNFNEEIIAQLSDKQIAAIEEYRAALMKGVYKNLEDPLVSPRNVAITEEDGSKIFRFFKNHWPRLLYGFCIFVFTGGVLLDILYNFGGFLEIFQLAAFISPPVAIALAATFTLLNLILYVAFEGKMLAEMFDVRPKADEKKKLDAVTEQSDLTTKIRGLVLNPSVNPDSDNNSKAYRAFLSCCDKTVKHKQNFFTDCNESTPRKWLRRVLTGVGALLSVGGAVFGGMSLVAMLCKVAFLVAIFSNPIVAAVFIGVVVLLACVSYFATAGKGIGSLVSPNLAEKQALRAKLEDKALVPELKKEKRVVSETTLEIAKPSIIIPQPEPAEADAIGEPVPTRMHV